MKRAGIFAVLATLASAGTAIAGSLVYTPVNPAFGGSPLNGSWIMQQATAGNHFNRASTTTSTQLTQSQIFAQQLQSQLYASLANQITQAIFGVNAQQSGTFSFEGTTISFTKANGQTNITINDGTTITQISLPTVN
ncbi:curli production assembly/transport component CsgF [Rhodopseudomonas pseudopalustris]|uniref:Curli production assembly/transport component CsgF n=1 Tax=Rhodopseudomonas pseudopalustris TaxID=1513892 RepID=A0A1H8T356_9BRAD|nr:curli production assembly/transport component CsgF [Rhodopseudomonas pseudopalustris]SEO84963.1 curli production assembly/transport component CsgF [Rhodopseudomonas pseudopalustris]